MVYVSGASGLLFHALSDRYLFPVSRAALAQAATWILRGSAPSPVDSVKQHDRPVDNPLGRLDVEEDEFPDGVLVQHDLISCGGGLL